MSDFIRLVLLALCLGVSIIAVISTMQVFGFLCGLLVCLLAAVGLTYLNTETELFGGDDD